MKERIALRKATIDPVGTPVVLAASDSPAIRTEAMHFHTGASEEFWDFTNIVRDVVKRSSVGHGQITIYTPHTTTSIVINESETGFLNDFRKAIDRTVPLDAYYEHDDHDVRTEKRRNHIHREHLVELMGDTEYADLGVDVEAVARLDLNRRRAVRHHAPYPICSLIHELVFGRGAGCRNG